MGLATAPALMQTVMVAVARAVTVQKQIPEVRVRVYWRIFFLFTILHGIPDLLSRRGLQINGDKSILTVQQHPTYLGICLDLTERLGSSLVQPDTQQLVIRAITSAPRFTQLVGFVNFICTVAKVLLQLVIAILRDPA